jgi:hypothetical protein
MTIDEMIWSAFEAWCEKVDLPIKMDGDYYDSEVTYNLALFSAGYKAAQQPHPTTDKPASEAVQAIREALEAIEANASDGYANNPFNEGRWDSACNIATEALKHLTALEAIAGVKGGGDAK